MLAAVATAVVVITSEVTSTLAMFRKIVLFFEIYHWQHLRAQSLSCVQLFATPWTVAHQALLSLGFILHHKH